MLCRSGFGFLVERFVVVMLYIAYRAGLWNWCGPLQRECATALVGVTFRILSERVFPLSPLL